MNDDEPVNELAVATVMFGQVMPDGCIADEDMVVLTSLQNGAPVGQSQMTAEQAMIIANALARGAGTIFSNRVDDTGKRAGFLGALAAMNRKHS